MILSSVKRAIERAAHPGPGGVLPQIKRALESSRVIEQFGYEIANVLWDVRGEQPRPEPGHAVGDGTHWAPAGGRAASVRRCNNTQVLPCAIALRASAANWRERL